MNDEAADSTDAPTGPAAWTPPTDGAPEPDAPQSAEPPPAGANNPPPWAAASGPAGPSFSRDNLVRPKQGRYVAGVCAALGRATNTDPVLWRVLIAVLSVLSGVGVLLYLVGWLATPAEGDTASPIESLLGKGRSGMAPLSIVLLGAGAVLSFAFIVQDGMRASILAAAVILGAVLLIKRSGAGLTGADATFPAAAGAGTVPPAAGADPATTEFTPPIFAFPPFTTPRAATAPFAAAATATQEPVTPPVTPPFAPSFSPAAGGYRPPFAPHGPYAQSAEAPYPPQPPAPPARRPRRERSKLGRLTFFALVVVVGVLAALDTSGAVSVSVSAYFAAALAVVALGLITGAWVGRAHGLIALAVIACIGLSASTAAERYGGHIGKSVYRPADLAAVADRYDFTAGNATLDLRAVDFTGQTQDITATMRVGQLRILLPADVDTTATVRLKNGRAVVLGKEYDDSAVDGRSFTDLGKDGVGGGTLLLDLQMDTGNLEVIR